MNRKKYTNEELIQILKNHYVQFGEPKYDYFDKDPNLPNAGIYERRFGTWSNAKILAGIPVTNQKNKYDYLSDDELLNILREQFIQNPKLSANELNIDTSLPSADIYIRRFGSWNNVKRLIDENVKIYQYTAEELISIMKKAFEINPNLTYRDFCSKNNLPSGTAYRNCFGTFNNAKIKAGINEIKPKYKYTDDELLTILKKECETNPNITVKEFNKRKDLPSTKVYVDRFESFNNAKHILGYKGYTYNKQLEYSDEELIYILRNYYKNIGFPRTRDFTRKNNLPCARAYINRFGSFQNAIKIAGIEIPKNRKKIFNRINEYTFEEIKEECQMLIDLYLQDHIKLPPLEYFNNSEFVSESMLYKRFGKYKEVYEVLGYNYDIFNNELLEKDMIEKYKEIWFELKEVPNSRDIDRYSRNSKYYYGCTTYLNHFGGMKGLYETIGDLSNLNISKYITKEEIIENLYRLKDKLGFIPTQIEINQYIHLPNVSFILNKLGYSGMAELQIDLFGEKIERANKHITEKGTKCLSTYEYIVAQVIENEDYNFIKDERYRNHMDIDKNYSCDFVILHNNKPYFIEVFGMMGHKPYEEKTKLKIQLCKNNNIPLLELYPKDISTPQMNEIRIKIKEFISNN